jgi:hypothetical protein
MIHSDPACRMQHQDPAEIQSNGLVCRTGAGRVVEVDRSVEMPCRTGRDWSRLDGSKSFPQLIYRTTCSHVVHASPTCLSRRGVCVSTSTRHGWVLEWRGSGTRGGRLLWQGGRCSGDVRRVPCTSFVPVWLPIHCSHAHNPLPYVPVRFLPAVSYDGANIDARVLISAVWLPRPGSWQLAFVV